MWSHWHSTLTGQAYLTRQDGSNFEGSSRIARSWQAWQIRKSYVTSATNHSTNSGMRFQRTTEKRSKLIKEWEYEIPRCPKGGNPCIKQQEEQQYLGKREEVSNGYNKILCHFVYNVKFNRHHKARFVAGGHQTDLPIESL
jgi:hypothetical protein